jgi:threonine dehydrogenase-like Zn-dependent dehydrogenase
MQGVVFLGNRHLELREFPDPEPAEREVIVEIRASGMCGSDLMYYRAPGPVLPVIRGHEPCGVIVERGSRVSELEAPIGQRVMIHHYSRCGSCNTSPAGETLLGCGARCRGRTAGKRLARSLAHEVLLALR